ncbi:MAG: glycerol-3-phosphate acyltransferase PlsY [Planctomycetota bacterium]|jgi:glycerol-3-phosphate acyltransferase PlsY
MPTQPSEIGLIIFSYLLGALPFGLLIARAKGIDLRAIGSGNIGATNTMRALGRGWGVTAFCLDFVKGMLPAGVFAALVASDPEVLMSLRVACGTAAVLGHCFPVYLRFKGGKGVATGCGAIVAIDPFVFLSAGLVWLVGLALFRFVSLSSVLMGLAFPIVAWLRHGEEPVFIGGTAMLTLLVLIRHKTNIARIIAGTEPRIGGTTAASTADG